MGKYLVVANQTLGGDQLMGEVRRRMATEPSSFHVVVPNTRPSDMMRLLGEPRPSASGSSESEDEHRATLIAQSRLHQALNQLRAEGVEAQVRSAMPIRWSRSAARWKRINSTKSPSRRCHSAYRVGWAWISRTAQSASSSCQ